MLKTSTSERCLKKWQIVITHDLRNQWIVFNHMTTLLSGMFDEFLAVGTYQYSTEALMLSNFARLGSSSLHLDHRRRQYFLQKALRLQVQPLDSNTKELLAIQKSYSLKSEVRPYSQKKHLYHIQYFLKTWLNLEVVFIFDVYY